jgi:protein O-GlcNAc transferase
MNDSRDIMARAQALHRARNPEAAAVLYQQALALDPEDADALHLLGVARAQIGDPASAASLIGRAIARRSGVAIFHLNLARALLRLGRSADAIAALRRAVAL